MYEDRDAEAKSYTSPRTGEPMFGERFAYGTSERPCYPCNLCSSPNGLTLVSPSDLAEHNQSHVEGWAAWQAEHGVEA